MALQPKLALLGGILPTDPRPQEGLSPRERLLPGLRAADKEPLCPGAVLPPPPSPSWREASASGIFQPFCSLGWTYLSWPPSPGLFKTDFFSFAFPSSWPQQHSTERGLFSRSHRTLLYAAAHPCLSPQPPGPSGATESSHGQRERASGPGPESQEGRLTLAGTGTEWRKSSPKTRWGEEGRARPV